MSINNSTISRLGNSGLQINHAVVGTMLIGTNNNGIFANGVDGDEDSMALLKKCYDRGLRTFDTADVYSSGHSEEVIGKFLKKYDIPRDTVVILTKCYFAVDTYDKNRQEGLHLNNSGLSRKHILDAVDDSVRRLGTHIDLLQIHRYDPNVPDEEVMRALNDVVESGKVRYLGASSMKTYQFIGLQHTAELNGWHKFVSMQSMYNLIYREDERELNAYCNHAGIGLLPWSPNARGLLALPWTSAKIQEKLANPEVYGLNYMGLDVEHDKPIIDRVEELSKKYKCTMAEIAGAWLVAKGTHPIIGVTSEQAIDAMVAMAHTNLSKEDVEYLEEPYKAKMLVFTSS
ncbi:hypothetical protein PGUG_02190 [Meyerozyma guilliermondii ATCC 6260]|uniref:NADP-dependent oxidoreductase domain-containing protein n=1 Tax=Meyerozyma guilliermondii (strain ATCC 6260 / CBS 566 / DSM 6381 / JCM 1539 / NBRC 10279 / NRRL Y-324) TaxID=294746 RepID=A5DFY9_PICGU|nr:uncharacterized protein PGUG_02190 [Meyerozyma guilliermondii ATCC 6260]EDK38092.2 hypothetical protein PGUG_02190 [Meyerozyma guilliermondii ATCC 6260]